MRVVVQRVTEASVSIDDAVVGQIGPGLMALVGFCPGDDQSDMDWMAEKLLGLRIFTDDLGKMNLGLNDIAGELLLVPNFTLYGDCRKGRRPGFSGAMEPEAAEIMFGEFCAVVAANGLVPQCGVFGAHMHVALVNDGPVTLILDSPQSQQANRL